MPIAEKENKGKVGWSDIWVSVDTFNLPCFVANYKKVYIISVCIK